MASPFRRFPSDDLVQDEFGFDGQDEGGALVADRSGLNAQLIVDDFFEAPAGAATRTGTGAGTTSALTGAATAKRSQSGTGAGTLPALTGSASGTIVATRTGTGAGTLAVPTGAAAGARGASGAAAGQMAVPTGSAAATRAAAGAGVGTSPALAGSAAGARGAQGTAAGTLEALTGTGAGLVESAGPQLRSGAAAGEPPALGAAGTGWTSAIVVVQPSEMGGSEYPVRPITFPTPRRGVGRGRVAIPTAAARGDVVPSLPEEVVILAEVA